MKNKIISFFVMKSLRNKLGRIGVGTEIHKSCQFNHHKNIFIGDYVSVQRDCTFSGHGSIVIGNGVVFAHCVDVFSGEHNYNSNDLLSIPFDERFICSKTVIEDGAWIGCHSIIMPGVIIGKGVVIGAGSIVTHDIPDYAIAVGNPAKVILRHLPK